MKNVIIMLAVIAMAAPLYAADPCDVVFAGDGSTGSLVLSYTTNNGALPRGIGLKCEVLAGDTVDVDSDAVVADPCFNTFIDYAFMDPGTFAIGDGHPMADPCFAGVLDPCTGVDVFSICMGVLDQTSNQLAGPATSTLVSIPLASTAGSVTIRISEDDLRGGVVGSALTTNLPIDVVVSFGCQCYGDVADNTSQPIPDGNVNLGDLNYVIYQLSLGGFAPITVQSGDALFCADMADSMSQPGPDGKVDLGDLNYMIFVLSQNGFDMGGCVVLP